MTVMTNEDPADPSAHEPKPVYVVWAENGNCIMWTTNKAQAEACAQKHERPMRTLHDQDVVAYQAEEIAELRAQVSGWRRQCDTLTHQVICCGVAASHPDATLTMRGAYAGKWNSAQAEQVRKLRAERDALSRQLDQIIEGRRCLTRQLSGALRPLERPVRPGERRKESMSDRDLIEACAKAAGLRIARKWQDERDRMIGRENARLWIVGGNTAWSPVDDDADAFRLAVDLKLKIEHEQDHIGWYTVAWDGYFGSGKHYHDDTDRRTATRYAICTIAARHDRKAVGA